MSLFMPMFRELIEARPDLLGVRTPGRFRYDGFAVERYVLRGVPRELPAERMLPRTPAPGSLSSPAGGSSPPRCPIHDSIDGPFGDAPPMAMTASDERGSAPGGTPS